MVSRVLLRCAGWFAAAVLAVAMGGGALADPAAGVQVPRPPLLGPDVPLSNPMSGLYASFAQNPATLALEPANPRYTAVAPTQGAPSDEYGRVSWHSLEPVQGRHDFDILDAVLRRCPPSGAPSAPSAPTAACLPAGAKFGFRIMALNPQTRSDTNVTTGADGYPVYADVPAYMETGRHGWLLPADPRDATQGQYFIPDWNDPFFPRRAASLLHALGKRYDGDPRIGWVDIGL